MRIPPHKLVRMLATSLALFLLISSSVTAQERLRRFEVFAEFAGSFFSEKRGTGVGFVQDPSTSVISPVPTLEKSSLRRTGRLFAGFRFYPTDRDGIEISYSYSPSDIFQRRLTTGPSFITPAVVIQEVRASFVSFNYVRYLLSEGRWRPYITGGLGFVHLGNLQSPNQFTANFGGGTDIVLTPTIALRVEYRDFLLEHPQIARTFSPTGLSHNQVPSAGLVFRF